VGHVRHELRAHVLEPPQLGHVVEHHDQAPLVAPERERQRLDFEHAPGRRGEAHLAPQHAAGRPGAAVAEQLVQLDVSDHLEKRLVLASHRAEPEDGARPLVHHEDVLVAVHRDDALDHPVEDRGDLRALLVEVLDLLAQPRRKDVQRPAEGADLVSAYRKALACDSTSAFGGIVALNRTLDADAARAITEIFTEVIIAPDATDEAIAIVATKKNLRLLLASALPDPRTVGLTAKTVAGGLLVQSRDNAVVDGMTLKVATRRAPTDAEMRDLKFAFRVAKHVKSNTIVYAKDLATVGIGAGQMSRVDSARIAARKAQDAADELKLAAPMTRGSVVASDAFFPFADGLLVAIEAGATAVIQPGGSIRDDEVIKAADDAGIAMVFTGVRHFRH